MLKIKYYVCVGLNDYLNIASSKKQSDLRDFLKARFVKKGCMEMIKYCV